MNAHVRCAAFEVFTLVVLKCGRRRRSQLSCTVVGPELCFSGGDSEEAVATGRSQGQGQTDLNNLHQEVNSQVFLCMVSRSVLISYFYMYLSNFPSTTY